MKIMFDFFFKGFNIYLSIVGSLWLGWLLLDISKYISSMQEYWEKGREPPEIEFVEGPDGELLISIPLSPEKIPQYYCFATGRHSGSNFLKV